MLTRSLPSLKIHFDLNETNLPYPCGHTVLRVEGTGAHLNQIKSTLLLHGVKSEEMEDKICR